VSGVGQGVVVVAGVVDWMGKYEGGR